MTGNMRRNTCTASQYRVVDARNLEQASIEGSSQDVSTCAFPALLPLCTNRQSNQLAAKLPTQSSKKDHGGYTQHTGATSTPGGYYVREKNQKTIQQQVKSETARFSARVQYTQYGQINFPNSLKPFHHTSNTITTVSQLSSPTTTTF